VEKEEVQHIPSMWGIIAALKTEKEIGLTKIKGTAYFENFVCCVRINSTNLIANVLEIQSGSKSCSFGVDAEW
jgi:hypothetical protein